MKKAKLILKLTALVSLCTVLIVNHYSANAMESLCEFDRQATYYECLDTLFSGVFDSSCQEKTFCRLSGDRAYCTCSTSGERREQCFRQMEERAERNHGNCDPHDHNACPNPNWPHDEEPDVLDPDNGDGGNQ